MIDNTFLHIKGVGHKSEEKFWHKGYLTWEDFIRRGGTSKKNHLIKLELVKSKNALEMKDYSYFQERLSKIDRWRFFDYLKDSVAYIDIETTGFKGGNNYITTIALYDGKEVKYYVHGKNLKKFKKDIKTLDTIQTNQAKFLDKFDEMSSWHNGVTKAFENFTEVQLPSLDDVVHKHIDILRVAEQDHFNKVKSTLEKAVESRCDIAEDMELMKENLNGMSTIHKSIATAITKQTIEQLSEVTKPFENQIVSLKSHTELINTSLYEDESRLSSIREQSEIIMKQMILSSKKMSTLEGQTSNLHDVYGDIKSLISDIEVVKADYVKSQAQLESIAKDLEESKSKNIVNVKEEIQKLSSDLVERIDNSLEKLHKHYHIANEDISKSVQFLAKKAQVKNGYIDT